MKKLYTNRSIFGRMHIWKIFLFVIFFCPSININAQIKTIGVFNDTIPAIAHKNDTLYAVSHPKNYANTYTDTINLNKWDGSNWTIVARLPFMKINAFNTYVRHPVTALHILKDDFYITGYFDSLPGINGKTKIVKWDGQNWSAINNMPFNFLSFQRHLTTFLYDDKLFVQSSPYLKTLNIAYYDGNKWVKGDSAVKLNDAQYTRFESANNKLYIVGYFNGEYLSPPFEWKGNYWEQTNDTPLKVNIVKEFWFGMSLRDYKDGHIRFRKNAGYTNPDYADSVEYWDGQQLHLLNNGYLNNFDYALTHDIVSYDGFLYRVGVFKKGTNTDFVLVWDGAKWIPFKINLPEIISPEVSLALATKNNLFMVGGNSYKGNSTYVFNLKKIVQIKGNVYYDLNNNCLKDGTEDGVNNSFLKFSTGHVINTDQDGNYTYFTGSGSYEIKLLPKKYFKQNCPGNDSSIIVNTGSDTILNDNNFAFSPKYPVQDMRVKITAANGWRARKGFTEYYTLTYENAGTTIASGELMLKLDSESSNFDAFPKPVSNNFPVAKWNFDSLKIGEKRYIFFHAKTDSATLADSLIFSLAFNGGNNWQDSSLTDNFDTLAMEIVAALDPNDKTSYPAGDITADTKELRYHIRFQNLGTDTAYKVTIIDTIDTNLPLTKVVMNLGSHAYKLDIKNNVFKWTFEDIMLPHSAVNEPLSHGFINYSAQIKPGVAIGTEIKNTAYIYFDYQKPVITNTARNKMVEKTGVSIKEEKQSISAKLHIYPNPASKYLFIKNEDTEVKEIQIINILGQVQMKIKVQPFELKQISTTSFKSGIYFIHSQGEGVKKVIVE